jgi:hypothetical protein
MKFDVFISHSRADKPIADAACARLEGSGIRCWIAPRDIYPGTQWAAAIVQAIDNCAAMVLIFSSHANVSGQIQREVERAVNKSVPIIPLRIEEVTPTGSMEYYLGSIHWLDALTPPIEKHLDHLVETVRVCVDARTPRSDTSPQVLPKRIDAASNRPGEPSVPRKRPTVLRRSWWTWAIGGAAGLLLAAAVVGGALHRDRQAATVRPTEQAGATATNAPIAPVPTPASTEVLSQKGRVALVVGNAKYQHLNALPTPLQDASAMASLFESAGFQVFEGSNLDRNAFRGMILKFARIAQAADLAAIYYSGHGIAIDGLNYLLPVDAALASELDVQDEAVSLDRILSLLDAMHGPRLIILDASREIPALTLMQHAKVTRGLSPVGLARVDISSGTLVASSTDAGSIADDGDGPVSRFTASVAKRLAVPAIDVELALRQVRADVFGATGGRQRPVTYAALLNSFQLIPRGAAVENIPP